MQCPGCATEIAEHRLECPFCHTLVHQERLSRLAEEARVMVAAGDHAGGVAHWREALSLLPPGSKQAVQIADRISQLTPALKTDQQSAAATQWGRYGAGLGAIGLLLWKLKFLLVFLVTKGKLLLLGLTKGSTFFSMLLSMGVYWTVFGWKFALGLVLSIYVHEMGHVFALNRLGIKASAPMFIPGFGAVVRMHQYPASPSEDAQVGLAGPLWGLFAALAAWLVYRAGGGDIWGAIAHVGAWINLFNLIPVWQLDGHRGFRALSRPTRVAMLALVAATALYSEVGMLWLIVIAGAFTLRGAVPERNDPSATGMYALLILALSYLSSLQPLQA